MPIDQFADNAETTLTTAIDTDDTTIVVADGSRFPTPGAGYYATLADNEHNPVMAKREVVRVTAKSGNSFTVTRNAWGEGAQSFGIGARFEQRITAATASSWENAAAFAETWYDVRTYGALGDGTTDDTAAIQAAIDAAKVAGTTIFGAVVRIPPGRYLISDPLILPRSGATPTNIVWLVGDDIRTCVLIGDASFPPDRAMIEWQATAARAWHQRITNLGFVLPNVDGTKAIHYLPTDVSSQGAILAETLQITLDNLLLEGSNSFHEKLIHLQGNVKFSRIQNIYGDCAQGALTYDTIVLETDSTYGDDDGSGLVYSSLSNIHSGLRRGGFHQTFKGRLGNVVWEGGFSNGAVNAPSYEFVNAQQVILKGLATEGQGEKPQYKFTNGRTLYLENIGIGAPNEAVGGQGVGNGMELIGCTNLEWRGRFARSGSPSFNASGVKLLTLDANCTRCRFYGILMNDSLADEVTNSAPASADNYGEFYDIAGGVMEFMGTRPLKSLLASATAGSILFVGTAGILEQNNATFFVDNATGRLGVGTNTPAASRVHIKTATSGATPNASADELVIETALGGLSILTPNTGTGQIWFGDPEINSVGRIVYTHADNVLAFFTNAAKRMAISGTGSVGINEAEPDYKLDVNGSFGFTPGASVTPVDNGDVVIEATNNTTLTLKLKGSDGTVRSGTVTLA